MKLRRPAPALAIACLALFISLGGVSYGVATGFIDSREIRNNTVRTQDVRNNDLRGRDIRNSTILARDVALDTLTGGDINESRLAKVPDADALDGVDSSGFVRKDSVGFQLLPLAVDWSPVAGEPGPQMDVDALGNVQLRGVLERGVGADDKALTLPAAGRPSGIRRFAVWAEDGPVNLTIDTAGALVPESAEGQQVALDGVTFRAAGP